MMVVFAAQHRKGSVADGHADVSLRASFTRTSKLWCKVRGFSVEGQVSRLRVRQGYVFKLVGFSLWGMYKPDILCLEQTFDTDDTDRQSKKPMYKQADTHARTHTHTD